MVEIRGFEPLAYTMRTYRATICAISPDKADAKRVEPFYYINNRRKLQANYRAFFTFIYRYIKTAESLLSTVFYLIENIFRKLRLFTCFQLFIYHPFNIVSNTAIFFLGRLPQTKPLRARAREPLAATNRLNPFEPASKPYTRTTATRFEILPPKRERHNVRGLPQSTPQEKPSKRALLSSRKTFPKPRQKPQARQSYTAISRQRA